MGLELRTGDCLSEKKTGGTLVLYIVLYAALYIVLYIVFYIVLYID